MVKRSTYEDDLQRAVAQYLDLQGWLWCHVPNGARMGGKNPAVTGGIMKGLGLKPGVPDVLIFERWEGVERYTDTNVPRFHGFGVAIELKSPRGRLQPSQADWLEALRARGWRVEVCRTLQEVIAVCECISRRGR
jgi:hypothetical protein